MRISQGMGWGLLAIAIAAPVSAQSVSARPFGQPLAQSDPKPPSPSTRASDLIIKPRVGGGYSTSGGGYEGYTSFDGFIPLAQTPGKDLLFLQAKFLLDNSANVGGNLLVGYRAYQSKSQRIWGGYLAYDTRDTGNHTFSQLGMGLETLGDRWDIRANGYIPLGKTSQTVNQSLFDSGFQISNTRFQNNFLLASGTRQQSRVRDLDVALAGFDLEGGTRLLRFGNSGDLRGYAGLYYLSGGNASTAGFRARLEAHPTDNLILGVGVQHDGIFGTNVVGTIALTFPGARPKGVDPESVLARMGESTFRNSAIAVDRQTEITNTSTVVTDLAVLNPSTGQPYFFEHVILGRSGGDGTFENPFGVVQAALNATRSTGNEIVYVQAGTNPGIPAFTIPDRVQVLSTGPKQVLNAILPGATAAPFQLPLSGSGIYPTVTDTVTMRNDTVLSGFAITSPTGAGVTFNTVSTVEVRDNRIANTGDAGILGNGVQGVTLLRNEITSAKNQGIYIQNVGTATVTDNVVRNTIACTTSLANPITGDLSVPNPLGGTITIPNPGSIVPLPSGQGIVIGTVSGSADILRNTISGTATQGIVLLNASGNLAIADNSIASTTGADVNYTLPAPFTGSIPVPTGQGIVVSGLTNATLDITRNTVNNTRGQGLVVASATGTVAVTNNAFTNTLDQGMSIGSTSGTLTIANNQISDIGTRSFSTTATFPVFGNVTLNVATGQGMTLAGVTGTVNITSNTIERVAGSVPANTVPLPPGGQGLYIANASGDVALNLTANQIRNNYNDAVFIGFGNTATATLNITGNTIDSNGGGTPIRGDGLAIAAEQSAKVNLAIENNTIQNNGDDGIDIRLGSLFPAVASTAQVTGTIRNNSVTINSTQAFANTFAGIQIEARSNTKATVAIESNTVAANNSFAQAINLQTFSANPIYTTIFGGSNPQISATVRFNILTGASNPAFRAQTGYQSGFLTIPAAAPQTICVNLNGNSSPIGGYALINTGGGTLQSVTGGTNTGTVTNTGTITSVTTCP